jgi:hypothetical protein
VEGLDGSVDFAAEPGRITVARCELVGTKKHDQAGARAGQHAGRAASLAVATSSLRSSKWTRLSSTGSVASHASKALRRPSTPWVMSHKGQWARARDWDVGIGDLQLDGSVG